MFDTKDGNALQDLAANGASPNAFTSTAITGYYFESTEKFEENLKILLSFVSVPWFTKESVDKEQGIIGQEIRMIEDDPENQVFYGMLEALYEHNPVRVSIAGTVESIAEITAETLYACHAAFYNPGNMTLCVAGNVDPAGSVRSHGRSFPRRDCEISRGITAAKNLSRHFARRQCRRWRSPRPFFNWGGRRTPLRWEKSICAGNL